jgi:hypothetical protein
MEQSGERAAAKRNPGQIETIPETGSNNFFEAK